MTEPVGVGFPVPPVTANEAVNDCAVVMVGADKVNFNVGAIDSLTVTVTAAEVVVVKFSSPL